MIKTISIVTDSGYPFPSNKSLSRREKTNKFLRKLFAQRYIQAMALLGAAWMLIFNYAPMYGIIIAFKQYNIIHPISEAPWVGFKVFEEFIQSDDLWVVVKNTLGISLIKLFIGFPLPIIFALFLNEVRSLRYKRFVQTISYMPHFLSWVVLGGIMATWLSDVGIINEALINFNIIKEPIYFLAEPQYFWGIVITSDIWKEIGWSAIIYLAAMAGVSQEMYEAATIDGAGRFQKMWYVTIPSIKAAITILFILAISGILNSNFDQILVLRNSLNQSASDVIDIFVYRVGLQNARYSFAAAVGLMKAIFALILLLIANQTMKKLNDSSLF